MLLSTFIDKRNLLSSLPFWGILELHLYLRFISLMTTQVFSFSSMSLPFINKGTSWVGEKRGLALSTCLFLTACTSYVLSIVCRSPGIILVKCTIVFLLQNTFVHLKCEQRALDTQWQVYESPHHFQANLIFIGKEALCVCCTILLPLPS